MFFNNKNLKIFYHFVITIVFVIVFYNLLTMKTKNVVYGFWHYYITNKYCFILYLLLSLFILSLDSYTGILLLVLAIGTFKSSNKEFFTLEFFENITPTTTNTNLEQSNLEQSNVAIAIPTKIIDGQIVADIPRDTAKFLQNTISKQNIQAQALGEDERFKVDEVVIKDILRQIKSQVDFDPYKTQLDKDVIYEIYNTYFDNDIFKKLQNNNSDSASYIAAGNFNYVPAVAKVDYDLVTYQNLSNNTGFGINPLTDGLANKTQINRG